MSKAVSIIYDEHPDTVYLWGTVAVRNPPLTRLGVTHDITLAIIKRALNSVTTLGTFRAAEFPPWLGYGSDTAQDLKFEAWSKTCDKVREDGTPIPEYHHQPRPIYIQDPINYHIHILIALQPQHLEAFPGKFEAALSKIISKHKLEVQFAMSIIELTKITPKDVAIKAGYSTKPTRIDTSDLTTVPQMVDQLHRKHRIQTSGIFREALREGSGDWKARKKKTASSDPSLKPSDYATSETFRWIKNEEIYGTDQEYLSSKSKPSNRQNYHGDSQIIHATSQLQQGV